MTGSSLVAERCRDTRRLKFVHDASFEQRNSSRMYDPEDAAQAEKYEESYMPDEVTRDIAKRMHYAAYRENKACKANDRIVWRNVYFDLRDRIVLGNRKLVYRAVRRQMSVSNRADDLIGDCHIVMIQAVAAFNPWLGIRFSTYAFTCLVRALSRLNQRAAHDWFARSASINSFPDGEPGEFFESEPASSSLYSIDEFLRDDHPLLSSREKTILSLRFCFEEKLSCPTLENVGRALGLSKERVRQLQQTALIKLRNALSQKQCDR